MANSPSNFKSLSTKKNSELALRKRITEGPVLSAVEGFTLFEILIVIIIIGILMIPIMGNFFKSQQRARDAKRKQDISNIANALEQYYGNCGYKYPNAADYSGTILVSGGSVACTTPAITFMSKVPQDPASGSYYCGIGSTCNNTQYQICATLEAETAPAPTGFCVSNSQ